MLTGDPSPAGQFLFSSISFQGLQFPSKAASKSFHRFQKVAKNFRGSRLIKGLRAKEGEINLPARSSTAVVIERGRGAHADRARSLVDNGPWPGCTISICFRSFPRASISFQSGLQKFPSVSKSCKKFPRIGTYQWVTGETAEKKFAGAPIAKSSAEAGVRPRAAAQAGNALSAPGRTNCRHSGTPSISADASMSRTYREQSQANV